MEVSLSEIPLFRNVGETELEKLFTTIVFQRKSYQPETLVVSQGEECNRLLILTEGTVKGEMTGPSGKSLKIEDMEAPSVLATAFLFGRKNFFPVNIISASFIRIIVIYIMKMLSPFQSVGCSYLFV